MAKIIVKGILCLDKKKKPFNDVKGFSSRLFILLGIK